MLNRTSRSLASSLLLPRLCRPRPVRSRMRSPADGHVVGHPRADAISGQGQAAANATAHAVLPLHAATPRRRLHGAVAAHGSHQRVAAREHQRRQSGRPGVQPGAVRQLAAQEQCRVRLRHAGDSRLHALRRPDTGASATRVASPCPARHARKAETGRASRVCSVSHAGEERRVR